MIPVAPRLALGQEFGELQLKDAEFVAPRIAHHPEVEAALLLMVERMGHSTTRAALIYQHRSAERDRLIADAMSKLAETEIRQAKKRSGTQRARKRRKAS